ncbi:HicB family protein [Dyella jiangningensis]|uniref:YlcI/YnfO family protein n=1 Tax=Dyella sp. AtDHG13 TaxID=1938897 RepID=UPI000884ABE1|nr:YlcI/YnfO family protein [Dyella sp. AtDHG13]PXV55955.1 HicB-like protein involved in pilus formation [Dyella sp. AtDHG13]SDK49184.1 HicB family protein [Dyella jiangningensis]
MSETVKLNLRLPPDLKEEASAVAEMMGLSLNAFVVQAVRNWTGFQAEKLVKYHRTMKGPADPAPAPQAAASRVVQVAKVGANQPCPCGSGQKYKRCHGKP